MSPDELRVHLEAIASRYLAGDEELVQSIQAEYWPGGGHDRADPVAAQWVRRWRPGTGHAAVPVCSCRLGRCALCN